MSIEPIQCKKILRLHRPRWWADLEYLVFRYFLSQSSVLDHSATAPTRPCKFKFQLFSLKTEITFFLLINRSRCHLNRFIFQRSHITCDSTTPKYFASTPSSVVFSRRIQLIVALKLLDYFRWLMCQGCVKRCQGHEWTALPCFPQCQQLQSMLALTQRQVIFAWAIF